MLCCGGQGASMRRQCFCLGNLEMDFWGRRVTRAGEKLDLTVSFSHGSSLAPRAQRKSIPLAATANSRSPRGRTTLEKSTPCHCLWRGAFLFLSKSGCNVWLLKRWYAASHTFVVNRINHRRHRRRRRRQRGLWG